MPQFQSLVTLTGQGKVATAIANQGAVQITHLAVGDGNGQPVTPLETQAALVHEVWRGAVTSVSRDPNHPTQVIVAAEIPIGAGPFVIREMALIASDGTLFAVQNTPEIEKTTAAQGATQSVTVHFRVVVATTANITVVVNPATLITVAGMHRAPFIAVDGFLTQPPANPATGALAVAAAAPTGAFAGLAHQFVQWTGTLWVSAPAFFGTIVCDMSTGKYWRRTATGWEPFANSNVPVVVPANVLILSTSGVYTKPANLVYARVRMVGGGASGGSSSTVDWGGGGGAGADIEAWLRADQIPATVNYTVGAGGASIAAGGGAGNAGGTTAFLSLAVTGGLAGAAGNFTGAGGDGGTPFINDPAIKALGNYGARGYYGNPYAGIGGASPFGVWGRGGSGGKSNTASVAGGQGIIIIEEYLA